MKHPLARSAGVVAMVIAAMAIGPLLTDHLSGNEALAAPFVRHGSVGETVHLRYAAVRVTGVRVARKLDGADAVVAAGRFLVVDFAYRARREPQTFLGLELSDAHGRRYAPVTRGSTCAQNVEGATGVPMYAMACFDVPRSALAGSRFRFSLGDYGVNGSGQRRDDLADVDLRISPPRARKLWAQNLTYSTYVASTQPLDKKPVRLAKPTWWDDLR
ncbi:MAG TPA: hypothetical protein VM093_03365 [Aeromicrobium sp.]|nr:hypothetical protein [Aeromicrobium sp.]